MAPTITRKRPVQSGRTVTVDGHTFSFVSVREAIEALRFVSMPGADQVFPCGWLVEAAGYDEDGFPFVGECGAPAVGTERGWRCFHGHGHVSMEARAAEGWDYFDGDEIEGMRQAGAAPAVEPVHMAAADRAEEEARWMRDYQERYGKAYNE